MMIPHPVLSELIRLMPPAGTAWPKERQLVFLQALDAVLCNIYGGTPMMIWIGSDGEIHFANHSPSAAHGEQPKEKT